MLVWGFAFSIAATILTVAAIGVGAYFYGRRH
jgi:hypothetical protein